MEKVVRRSNRFSLRLFKRVSSLDSRSTVCLCPFAVFHALLMTYASAQGNTKLQMAKAFKVNKKYDLHSGFQALLHVLHREKPEANWEKPFPSRKAVTEKHPFKLMGGADSTAELVCISGFYRHHRDADMNLLVVEVPFKSGQLSMVLFLGDNACSLKRFHKHLTVELYEKLIGQLSYDENITVNVPMLKLEETVQPSYTLQHMGFVDLFDEHADLGGTGKGLFVSDIMQKVTLTIDTTGMSASAAVSVALTDYYTEELPKAYRDVPSTRPFIYVIKNQETGVILFMGAVRVFDSKKDISATTDLWASQLTDGVVRSVFGFPDEDVARTDLASAAAGEMCLVNLVEFCGCWEQGFTRFSVQPFYVKPDQATMVPMMSQRNEFAYVRDSGYRCLRVPYECEAQLVLFVPSEMAGLDAILPSLSSWDQLKAVLDQAIWTTGVTLTLPKVIPSINPIPLRRGATLFAHRHFKK
ncbi:serpin, putative [Ixodes scapularis]|uniref:Serpin, putative n=1 Tax=Ixodes scapularis TaxID=6945 RepID=B7QM31_IXOSC|nr:serpin, putative [Ixodes scapularis]|eukprot:XP_002416236.1 serpin, putative [Ixodes scapularis]